MSLRNQNADETRTMALVFDNSNFEPNAKQSLSTLDRLQKALNASTKVRLFEEIQSGVKKVSGLDDLAKSIDTVQAKFSTLTSISNRLKERMTDSVYDFVTSTAKGITIDQLTAGWAKYEEKTQSVQTIMASTAKDWASQGQQMEYVNQQLEKLNWFTDETSYDFVDMTDNIGKFINAGVKMSSAVTAMEGISNWAAISGANVQQASRAMYNLSQAMGTGVVRLSDWMSIENAQMATMEFKNVALETAVALGTLKKESDGVYKTLAKGTKVTAKDFHDSLNEKWFTSQVLVETLEKYGEFTDALNTSMNRYAKNLTTSELLGYVDEYISGQLDIEKAAAKAEVSVEALLLELNELSKAEYDLGRRAFKAAQEAKTFTDAINATKDAASSAWMNIYETLFGNYLSQKNLWTNLANQLYDAFVSPVADLGDAVKEAFASEAYIGEKEWAALESSGIASPEWIDRIIEAGKKFGYITSEMTIDSENFTKSLKKGWFTSDLFDKIFDFNAGKIKFSDAIEDGITDVREFRKVAEELRNDPVLGNTPDKWAFDYSRLGFNEEAYHKYVDYLTEQYNELKKTEGAMAVITDDMLDNAAAMLLSWQRGSEVGVEEAKRLIAEANEIDTSYESAAKAVDGFGKTMLDAEGNVQVLRKTAGEYWGEILTDGISTVIELVQLLGEEFNNVFGTFNESGARGVVVTLWEAVQSAKTFVETSKELRAVIDAVFGLARVKSALLTQVGKGLLEVVGSIFGIFDKGTHEGESTLVRILGYVNKFADFLKESNIIGNVFHFIAESIALAGNAVKSFFKMIDPDMEILGALGKLKDGFVSAALSSGDFFGGLIDSFKDFGQRVGKIHEFANELKDVGGMRFDSIGEMLGAFKDTVINYVSNFDGFKELKEAFKSLKEMAKSSLKSVGIDVDAIGAVFSTVAGFAKGAFNAIITFFNGLRNSEFVTTNAKRFKTAFVDFGEKVLPYFERLGVAFKEFKEKIKELDGIKISNLGTVFTEFYNTVVKEFLNFDGFEKFKDAFLGLAADVNKKLVDFGIDIPGFFDSIKASVDEFQKKVASIGGFKLENIFEIFIALKDTIVKTFTSTDWFEAIKTGLATVRKTIFDWFDGVGIDIEGIFQNVLDVFNKIVSFVAGLFGIEIDTSGSKKELKTLDGALDQAKAGTDALIGSVDKLTKKAGENLSGGGILDGLLSILGIVQVSADELETAEEDTRTILQKIQDAFATFFNNIYNFKLPPWLQQLKDDVLGLAYAFLVFKTVGDIRAIIDRFSVVKDAMAKSMDRASMLMLAGSIAILVGCVVALAKIPADQVIGAEFAVAAMGALLFGLFKAFQIFGGGGISIVGTAASMLALSLAIGTLVGLCLLLKGVKVADLSDGMAIIGIMSLYILGMTGLFAAITTFLGPASAAAGLTMLGVAASIGLLATITMLLGSFISGENGVTKAVAGLVAIAGMLIIMVTVFAIMTKLGIQAVDATKSMLSVGIAIAALAGAMLILQLLDWSKWKQILGGLAMIVGSIAILLAASTRWNGLIKDSGSTFRDLGILFLIMSGSFFVLGHMSWEHIVKGIVSLGALVGMVSLLMLAVNKVTESWHGDTLGKMGKTFLMIGAMFALMAASIIFIANFTSNGQALEAAGALAILLGTLTVSMALLSKFGKSLDKSMTGSLFILVGVIGALAIVIGLLSNLGGDKLIESSVALGIGILALTAACGAISLLGKFAGGMNQGLLAIGKLIGALLLIGGLEYIFETLTHGHGLIDLIEKAADVIGSLGTVIGKFVGNIVGGFEEGKMSHIEQIGEYMTKFSNVIGGIKADSFDQGLEAARRISAALTDVAWDSFQQNLAGFLGGFNVNGSSGDPIVDFKTRVVDLASALGIFKEKMTEIGKITVPVDAIKDLSNSMKELPFDKGGIFAIFGKDTASVEDVEAFKEKSGPMASALKEFADNLPTSLDSQKVTSAAYALKTLGELGKILMDVDMGSSGWLGAHEGVFGQDFIDAIGNLGTAIAEFSQNDFNETNILGIATAVKEMAYAIVKLASVNLTNTIFLSSADTGAFAGCVVILAKKLEDMNGYEFTGVDKLSEAMRKLRTIKLEGDITDDEKVAQFKKSASDLADAFKDVSGVYGSSYGALFTGQIPNYAATNVDTSGMEALAGFIQSAGGDSATTQTAVENIESIANALGGTGGLSEAVDKFTGASGEDGLGGALNTIYSLVGSGEGAAALDTLKGLGGIDTSNITELLDSAVGTEALSTLSGIAGLDFTNLDVLSDNAELLNALMGMNAPDGTEELTYVVHADTTQAESEIGSFSSSLGQGGYLAPNMTGLVQAQIDLSPVTDAVNRLQSANETSLHNVSDRIVDVATRIDQLADAINTIDLVLNTGVLVGEITPMINRNMGKMFIG